MRIELDYDKDKLNRVSGNYIKAFDCYEVEIISNPDTSDTYYRIELTDGEYINVTINELKALKQLLNNNIVTKLLKLDEVIE